LTAIKLLILDVDGVLTDGRLPYGVEGCEAKTFFVQDGGALRLWLSFGGEAAVISGRQSPVVETRCKELGIRRVVQGVSAKLPAYETIRDEAMVSDESIAYVGDDLLDVAPMQRCGYPIAVANALPPVKRVAHYVTRHSGGEGAVAEAVERILRHNGTWHAAMNRIEA
jgi:3-deoxy-D-manno-octulosonate 8-phosphate phosphatase (KDO 8-P phosphatase)